VTINRLGTDHRDPFNHHRHSLGLPKEMGFHDIFGFDPDLLAMVPQPCHAVLLLFPITDASEKAKDTEAAEIQANGQDVSENVREFLFMIFPHGQLE